MILMSELEQHIKKIIKNILQDDYDEHEFKININSESSMSLLFKKSSTSIFDKYNQRLKDALSPEFKSYLVAVEIHD